MRYQPIYDIAEICAQQHITQAVLCPGSRCAPLTLAFTRHTGITTRTFSDERSAAFVALGMAQATRSPIVIVSTSGTAAYNLAPAVAEAFFSETPLLIFTADRPAEWIAQHDGQTIYQHDLFGRHVKRSFQLPQDYDHPDSLWAINRIINDAINLSGEAPRGPVHINAPFREPLYPKPDEQINYTPGLRIVRPHDPLPSLTDDAKAAISSAWGSFNNILIVAGQGRQDKETAQALAALQARHDVPVVHDIISNLHDCEETIRHADLFLGQATESVREMLRPDLLITFGQSLIAKNLKNFLRKYPAKNHWHVQFAGPVADTFKHLTDIFRCEPSRFLEFLASMEPSATFEGQKQRNYLNLWRAEERRTLRAVDEFFAVSDWNELVMVKALMDNLPDHCNLHLANSMSVRYANFIGVPAGKKGIQVFSNRGTSGIDGSTSTAAGHSLMSDRLNFLITGDLAFFYDQNAFWHNYPLPNLRILLLNNHGGLIFDVLEGPSSMPEAGEFFITRQARDARRLCEEYRFDYLKADHPRKVKNLLRDFLEAGNTLKVMEVEGDTATNKQAFEQLKLKIKKSYEL